MSLESKFQAEVIKDIKEMLPDCIVLKNDPNYLQGFPDLLILYENKWAALEVKAEKYAHVQPNQVYYIGKCSLMSMGLFIYPENKNEILDLLLKFFFLRNYV